MNPIRLVWRLAVAVLLAGALGACATIPADAGKNPTDPWETYNRHMFEFNDRVDRAVLKPVAQAYTTVVPQLARDCLSNAFSNLNDVPNALNNLLQGKPGRAASDICRVAINTTIGLLGCFDLASKMGLEKSDEDFGQTLGTWGAGPGPYFVWPLLGPSTVRDSVGRVVGFYTDPLDAVDHTRTRNVISGTRIIDLRAQLLPAERVVEGAALDKYQFVRDAYLQRRRNLVFDGNPPREKDPEDEEEPPAAKPAEGSKDKPAAIPGNEKSAPAGDQPAPQPPR
jgi:phospholipid-binding lipoprotein MlaA